MKCTASFVFAFSTVVGIICYARGCSDGQSRMKELAIQNGAAEWYADPKTGVKELRWKCGEVPHEAKKESADAK